MPTVTSRASTRTCVWHSELDIGSAHLLVVATNVSHTMRYCVLPHIDVPQKLISI